MLSQQRQNGLIKFFKMDLHIYPDVTQIQNSQHIAGMNIEYRSCGALFSGTSPFKKR